MKIRSLFLAAIPAFLALQLVGCGDSPQPVDAPKTDAPNPPSTKGEGASGKIVFEGTAFDAPTGTLFVSVRPKGMKMPWLSRKFVLGADAIVKAASGERSLAFSLDPANGATFNSSPGNAPSVECEVAASYKEAADAMSKTLAEAVAPYQSGKSDYVLTLKLP